MFTPGRAAVLLVILTAGLYAPTLTYGWVYEDRTDATILTRSLADSVAIWTWQPARSLTQFTMHATYAVFGLWPGAYHAGNVAVHLLNGGLLYGLASSCLSPWAAVLAVGVFLLHPVQVESVAYVSNRADLLATTALLVGLGAVTRARWWLVALACVAAFLAKETGIVVLPLCAVFAVWLGARPSRLAVVLVSAMAATLGVYLLLSYPLVWDLRQALTQLSAWTSLLTLVVWPVGLTIDHDWNWITTIPMSLVAGLWAGGLIAAWYRRSSWFALAMASCLIVVAPRFGVSLVEGLHEHHLMVVMPALSIALASLLERTGHGVSSSSTQAWWAVRRA